MFTFETIIILSPEPEIGASISMIKAHYKRFFNEYLTKDKATMKDIGMKKLAYDVKSHSEGYYLMFTWTGYKEQITELERKLRLDDNVLKFITVKRDLVEDELSEYAEVDTGEELYENTPDQMISEQPAVIDAEDVMLGLAKYD